MNKIDISKSIYNILSTLEYGKNLPDLKSCIKSWWWSSFSLRLTHDGLQAFKAADIEYYTVPIGESNHETLSFKFGKVAKCPYYVDIRNYIIFDDRTYLKIMLHSDSITEYVGRKLGHSIR
jgi:hypothetical protein